MGYPDESAIHSFDRVLREQTPRIGYWLDSSDLTIAETVDRILHDLPLALIPGSTASS
jgi:hypothetical protein